MGRAWASLQLLVALCAPARVRGAPIGYVGPPTVHVQYGGQLEHNPPSRADAYKCEVCMMVVSWHGEVEPGNECNGMEFYAEICSEVQQVRNTRPARRSHRMSHVGAGGAGVRSLGQLGVEVAGRDGLP